MELSTVKPRFTDTHIIRTLQNYRQFSLSLGKESPYIVSKFDLLYTDTPLIRALSMTPSVSVLTGFDCKAFVKDSLLQDPSWKPKVCDIAFRYLAYHVTLLHLNNAMKWKGFSTCMSIRTCVSAKCQGPIKMKIKERNKLSEGKKIWRRQLLEKVKNPI